MSPAHAWRLYRPWFKTRRLSMKTVETSVDWVGIFYPGRRADLILINEHMLHGGCAAGTVLHELIHAEQHALGMPLDHGAYFQARRQELEARTGHKI